MIGRVGLVMENCGCTAVFREGRRVSATLLHLRPSVVVSVKTQRDHGYDAVVVGVADVRHLNKPQMVALEKFGISGKYRLFESRISDSGDLKSGDVLEVDHFSVGQYLDVTGRSIGKGFAGVMKRHGFHGMRASHGVSLAHRSQGSTGQCQDPGRVFKGKKMAGHMGARRVTVQNIEVLSVDKSKSLIVVMGNNIPGFVGARVLVKDALKKALPVGA